MSYKFAREFAISAHGDQVYGDKPYSYHLDAVDHILAGFSETIRTIGYLHDVVEDTDVTINEIERLFGKFVAESVSILTDESGLNRKERKRKTYEKMSKVHGDHEAALLVKAADRLANVRESVEGGNSRLLSMYKKEHSVFRESVFREGLSLSIWNELDELIKGA